MGVEDQINRTHTEMGKWRRPNEQSYEILLQMVEPPPKRAKNFPSEGEDMQVGEFVVAGLDSG